MQDPIQTSVSVVIACRNEIRHIRECLDSLLQQQWEGLDWEAVVADGMSDDGTREVLAEYCARNPRLRWIDNPGRIVSTGLNAAIRLARGSVIIRMDAHTMYDPSYCRRCVVTLLRTNASNAGGPARTRAQGVRSQAVAAAYHSPFSTGGARFHMAGYRGWVDTVPYGCWLKETLLELGLYDESLVRNQDDELNLRLIRRGGKIWQDPDIKSWYSPRGDLKSLFRQYFQYGFWKVPVLRKHKRPGSWRHLAPVAFVSGNLVLPVLWAAPFGRVSELAGLAWLACIGAYAALIGFASCQAAMRNGWKLLPLLPAVFATFHFSYGLGMMAGLLRRQPAAGSAVYQETVFSR
ncbi:MAG TPA: glycosyltransferase family 2 protein, partial [Bryobacteraceae bacterium]|nr:glycosyltransferase family 2 protein [Bryobacteraceae bacterium]